MELWHDAASLQAHLRLSRPRHSRSMYRTGHLYVWTLLSQSSLPELSPAPSQALSFRESVSSEHPNVLLPSSVCASGMKLPWEGVCLPHAASSLPPTFAFGLPAHRCAGNHCSGFHGNPILPPHPQMYATRSGWCGSAGPTCPATPSPAWQPPPGFHQSLSDPFLYRATEAGGRTCAAREMCRTNLFFRQD